MGLKNPLAGKKSDVKRPPSQLDKLENPMKRK